MRARRRGQNLGGGKRIGEGSGSARGGEAPMSKSSPKIEEARVSSAMAALATVRKRGDGGGSVCRNEVQGVHERTS